MLAAADLAAFLADDWRRQARLFPQAISAQSWALAPDSLCQLTESELVESRLVQADYEVIHGPFEFTEVPGQPLLGAGEMLMVQCLEQHLTSVAAMIDEAFDFLPRWQIDDVMASFGYDGANCGAHFDQYDVFLVQLTGEKIWHLDGGQHKETELDASADLRLLKTFSPSQTLTARPGDVLYIPPGVGHHGICLGESLTLSVGIRNPTTAEMLADLSEFALEASAAVPLESKLHAATTRLPKEAGSQIAAMASEVFSPDLVSRWYGCYVTRLRDPEVLTPGSAPASMLGRTLSASLPTRLSWQQTDAEDQALRLFVNGDCYELAAENIGWVRALCEKRQVRLPDRLTDDAETVTAWLVDAGALELDA